MKQSLGRGLEQKLRNIPSTSTEDGGEIPLMLSRAAIRSCKRACLASACVS